jgi:hypothetical protein
VLILPKPKQKQKTPEVRRSNHLKAPENQRYYGNKKDSIITEKFNAAYPLTAHVYFQDDLEKFKQTYHMIAENTNY